MISLVVQNGERRKPRCDLWEEDHSFAIRTPDVLFSTTLERDETIDNFGKLLYSGFDKVQVQFWYRLLVVKLRLRARVCDKLFIDQSVWLS